MPGFGLSPMSASSRGLRFPVLSPPSQTLAQRRKRARHDVREAVAPSQKAGEPIWIVVRRDVDPVLIKLAAAFIDESLSAPQPGEASGR